MDDELRPKVWWVTFTRTRTWSSDERTLRAPAVNSKGHHVPFRAMLSEVRSGHLIIAYTKDYIRAIGRATTDAQQHTGLKDMHDPSSELVKEFRVEVDYFDLDPAIWLPAVSSQLLALKIHRGPLDRCEKAKQGYIFRFNADGLAILRQATTAAWPEWAAIPNE